MHICILLAHQNKIPNVDTAALKPFSVYWNI